MYAICQKHFQTSQMAIWFYDMAELGNWYGSKVQIGSGWNSKVVYVLGTMYTIGFLIYRQGEW